MLASASRIRDRILTDAGVDHVCDPASIDEHGLKEKLRREGADVETAAAALAEAKARDVSARHPGAIVIGADQILEYDGRWFDKPPDRNVALATLRTLKGRTHRLISAAAVARQGEALWLHVETARLTMREFTEPFLRRYVDEAGDDILDSVGAYRLEGTGAQLFQRIDGDYFTILGLPLLPLLQFLREAGAAGE
ncbi:MAG: Maf family nucleotide pyrophosphatase [Rhodospirillales bacterium]